MALKKQIRKIDTNLFSGSSDTLKTAMGIYWNLSASSDAAPGSNEISASQPIITTGPTILNDVEAYELPDSDSIIKYVQVNQNKLTEQQTGPIVRYRFPVRIIGNNDNIENSTEWATILLGGTYGDTNYQQAFTANTYDVYSHNYDISYPELQRKQILNVATNQSMDISSYNIGYDYQLYLPEYQNNIGNKTEKELPNMYFNQLYSMGITDTDYQGFTKLTNISNFVTREGAFDFSIHDVHAPKTDQATETPPPFRLAMLGNVSTDRGADNLNYNDMSLNLRKYLTGAFISNDISEQTRTEVIEKSKNLYFCEDGTTVFKSLQSSAGEDIYKRYPMQANLSIPVLGLLPGTSSYTHFIKDNSLQEEVLSYIKGTFVGNSFGGSATQVEFAKEVEQLVADNENSKVDTSKQTSTIRNNMLDVPDMLLAIAQNPTVGETERELFLTSDATDIDGMKNINGAYRYTKTLGGMTALQQTLTKMNSNIKQKYIQPMIDNEDNANDFTHILDEIKNSVRTPEVIAYRIEKIGGLGVGDSRRREKLQDVYFFNNGLSFDGDVMQYYDTQVKYGEEYTYNVYAYMMVEGLRYRYSDLRVSRGIGEARSVLEDGSFAADGAEPHCIEFFDPQSGQAAEQLLNDETNLLNRLPTAADVLLPYLTPELRFAYREHFEQIAIDAGSDIAGDANAKINHYYNTTYGGPSGYTSPNFGTTDDIGVTQAFEDYVEWATQTMNYTYTGESSDGEGPEYDHGGGMIEEQPVAGDVIALIDPDKIKANRYATNAQIKAANKYLADFHFELEPTLKIIEVPLTSKYFTIMDHPPVACDVIPYQRKDNSQIIGFQINRETFPINKHVDKIFNNNSKFGLYPTPISPQEEQIKQQYLLSNNMLENEIIKKPSVSPPDKVDVYRIDHKPTSLQDFNNNLIHSVPLQYENDIYYNYSNCLYEEVIATNKKFYYLFKFVNENGMTGYVSPVQVAELVDDGGYKYAKFDVLFEDNLKKPAPKQPSFDFKKLIQITPASRHMDIVEDGLDTSLKPQDLIDSDTVTVGYANELLWNKKFKFRLTSKKTGRKLDFNITYKLRNS